MSAVHRLYLNCTESTLYKLPSHLTLPAEVKALTFIKDALTKDLESTLGAWEVQMLHLPFLPNKLRFDQACWISSWGRFQDDHPPFKSMFQEVGHKGRLPLALRTGDAFAYQLSCYTHSEYISMNFCFLKLVYKNTWKKKKHRPINYYKTNCTFFF